MNEYLMLLSISSIFLSGEIFEEMYFFFDSLKLSNFMVIYVHLLIFSYLIITRISL